MIVNKRPCNYTFASGNVRRRKSVSDEITFAYLTSLKQDDVVLLLTNLQSFWTHSLQNPGNRWRLSKITSQTQIIATQTHTQAPIKKPGILVFSESKTSMFHILVQRSEEQMTSGSGGHEIAAPLCKHTLKLQISSCVFLLNV